MSVRLKPSSVYVWRPQACMFERVCLSVYVCMPQTYIHKPNIHTQLVDLPYRKAFQEALERVCMFKNPLPVMKKRSNIHETHAQSSTLFTDESSFRVCLSVFPWQADGFQTYTVINTYQHLSSRRLSSMYVCLKTICLWWKLASNIHEHTGTHPQ